MQVEDGRSLHEEVTLGFVDEVAIDASGIIMLVVLSNQAVSILQIRLD